MLPKIAVASLTVLGGFAVGFSACSIAVRNQKKREAQEEAELAARHRANEDLKQYRDSHSATADPEGGVKCSCGFSCGSQHIYNLHIEHHCRNIGPFDATGWPSRQWETVPNLRLMQKGVVAKGDIPYAYFLTIHLRENFDEASVARVLSQIPSLTSAVSKIDETARLVSVIGVSNDAWRRLDADGPRELGNFTPKVCPSTKHEVFPSGKAGGHLFLLAKANRVDLPYELARRVLSLLGANVIDSQHTQGFAYLPSKQFGIGYAHDLTGFIDGTRNPDHLLRALVDEVCIWPDDEGETSPHVGGAYFWAGRFVHELQSFQTMSTEQKSALVGRKYGVIEPHKGYDQRPENPRMEDAPERSHVQRAFGSMYRQAYPYRHEREQGLFFMAFARSLSEIDTALARMAGQYDSAGQPDLLFSITRVAQNNYFYAPSMTELRALADYPAFRSATAARAAARVTKATSSPSVPLPAGTSRIPIYIEYCTNCGYNSIYQEKRKLLEALDARVQVIGNPRMPRQSAFEVTTADGTVLWSKLDQPGGGNNYPEVFPSNEHLIEALSKFLKKAPPAVDTLPKALIYTQEQTRMGVW